MMHKSIYFKLHFLEDDTITTNEIHFRNELPLTSIGAL